MALFKVYRGNSAGLDAVTKKDGNCYFCLDTKKFYVDYTDQDGALQRKPLNAADAETLCGMTAEQIIASVEIPDVNSLISAHNTSTTAHSDIRTLATGAQSAAAAAQSTADQAVTNAGVAQTRADSAYTLAESKADASHGNHVPTTETANNAKFLRNDNTWQIVTPENIGAAPTSHASTAATYGIGTGSNYGHVKLSDATNSTSAASAGIAASPAAVKAAYDLASTANTNASAAQTTANEAKTLAENAGGADVYTATLGTNWTEDSETGVKSQTVSIADITADQTAKVDAAYTGDGTSEGYATFVEQQNQFLDFITNGYAETVEGGITFYIFGDSNTVSIPIVVEVV